MRSASESVNNKEEHLELQTDNISKPFPAEIWFETFKHSSPQDLIKFRSVCTTFDLLIVSRIYNRLYLNIFKEAVQNGDLKTMKKIYEYFNDKKEIQKEMLTFKIFRIWNGKTTAFVYASAIGRLETIKQLYNWVSEEERQIMISYDEFAAFRFASIFGLDVMGKIYSLCSGDEREIIMEVGNYQADREVSEDGNLEVADQLYDWADDEGKLRMDRIREEDLEFF